MYATWNSGLVQRTKMFHELGNIGRDTWYAVEWYDKSLRKMLATWH